MHLRSLQRVIDGVLKVQGQVRKLMRHVHKDCPGSFSVAVVDQANQVCDTTESWMELMATLSQNELRDMAPGLGPGKEERHCRICLPIN